jgi:hypothetical protein
MFRRGLRRGMIRNATQPEVPPLLKRAHELMASKNFAAAAEAFEKLASMGEARNHPKTAQMYLAAGHARILAGQKPAGFAHLKKGLGLLVNRPVQLSRLGDRVVTELNGNGMTAESQEIASWLNGVLPAATESTRMGAAAPAKKPVLPTRCPGCGGAVRVDEVEWLDDNTAECNWCGSHLRAEG